MFIYFAGPLFSNAEREFNRILVRKLESLGYKVFFPQRDGVEKDKPEFRHLSKAKRRQKMFLLDIKKVKEADIFLFILDGRVPDEGACVELGVAYCLKRFKKMKKTIIALRTGIGVKAFYDWKLNPMLRGCFDFFAKTEGELFNYLKKFSLCPRRGPRRENPASLVFARIKI